MRLVKTDFKKKRKYSNNMELIDQFHKSDMTSAKVEEWTHKDAKSCCGCLRQAAVRLKLYHIHAVEEKGEVYLIKEEI